MMTLDSRHRGRPDSGSGPRFARPGGKARKNSRRRSSAPPRPARPPMLRGLVKKSFKLCRRGLKMMLVMAATLAAVGLVTVILVAGYLYVSKSDYFSVKRVTISGINQIGREDILAAAGLDRPVNILTFDPDQAARELSALPWLAEARVTRRMPDAVAIEVTEHRPRLLVSLGRLYYLNDRGEPFKELAPGESPKLPIVTGFGEDDLLSPGPAVKAALTEVFWLTDTLAQRNDEFRLDNISEINYDLVRGLTLFTKNNGLEVKIGFGAYEEKFRRLGRVLAHLKLRGQYEGLVYLNLEASPRVTVRYDEKMAAASHNS